MRSHRLVPALALLPLLASLLFGDYEVKIRDVATLKGLKKNRLYGYGLVVGLPGTGDGGSALARKTLGQFLTYAGIDADNSQLNTANMAVVAVSCELSGFVEKGDTVDVQVASIGSAKNLENGLLLQTALKSSAGQIYAMAGGVVGTGSEKQPRRGLIAAGAIVERSLAADGLFKENAPVQLVLKNPSLTTATTLKDAIEGANPDLTVTIQDYKQLTISSRVAQALTFKALADVLNLPVSVESAATIVIDKATGVVVGGQDVRVDTSFISLPGLKIAVKEGQGAQFSGVFKGTATVNDLAGEFNGLGIKPADMISIFLALKKAGALNAEIIVQ
ncbi:MAG: flagellar basal body P-ring protein FlgI [Spirochaetes bacterium]|nr:flagellar basal body P-ring protein FlgI [Spirochaetota bacterium]